MKYKELCSAEKAKIITDIVSRFAAPMANSVVLLGGDMIPEFILRTDRDEDLREIGHELYAFVQRLHDELNSGSEPVGFTYESVHGIVREPLTPDDERQAKLLAEYDEARKGKLQSKEAEETIEAALAALATAK